MLLPRHDELGADDPRIELVDRLIEYKKYRDAVDYLMPKQNASQMLFFKQPDEIERPEAEKIDLSLPISKLMKAFEDILERRERRAPIRLEAFNTIVQRDTVPIRVRLRAIMDQFKTRSKLQFEELFDDCKRRAEAVSTFLALLELIRSGRIAVYLENDKIICISNIDSALNQYMGEENESQGNQGDN
jgi:segregation and condensation protein A